MKLSVEKLENPLEARPKMLKAKIEKRIKWENKRSRIKFKLLRGSKPRLVVYRSNKNIFAQIVDDNQSKTLVAASSLDKGLQSSLKKANSKIEKSSVVVKTNKRRACRIGDVLFIGTEISCLLMTTKI